MIYRGWRIVVIIDMPHAYVIKDVHEVYSEVRYGKEIQWQPKLRPEQYDYTKRFSADKDDRTLPSTKTYGAIKKLIDKEEDSK